MKVQDRRPHALHRPDRARTGRPPVRASFHANDKNQREQPHLHRRGAPGTGQGRIGTTLSPGKTDRYAMSGLVDRDLPTYLDAIRD